MHRYSTHQAPCVKVVPTERNSFFETRKIDNKGTHQKAEIVKTKKAENQRVVIGENVELSLLYCSYSCYLEYYEQPIFGLTQEWFRELSFSRLECGVHDVWDILLPLAWTPDRRDQRLLVSHPKDTEIHNL